MLLGLAKVDESNFLPGTATWSAVPRKPSPTQVHPLEFLRLLLEDEALVVPGRERLANAKKRRELKVMLRSMLRVRWRLFRARSKVNPTAGVSARTEA